MEKCSKHASAQNALEISRRKRLLCCDNHNMALVLYLQVVRPLQYKMDSRANVTTMSAMKETSESDIRICVY